MTKNLAKKILLRGLFGVLGLLALTILIVLGLALTVWMKPQLVINNKSVNYLLRHFELNEQVQFQNFDLKAYSPSFFQKHLSLGLTDFCFQTAPPPPAEGPPSVSELAVKACSSEIQVELGLDFSDWQIRLTSEPVLVVRAGELDLRLPESSEAPSETMPDLSAFDFESWFGKLKRALPEKKWGRLEIEMKSFFVKLEPATEISGQVTVTSLRSPEELMLDGNVSLRVRDPKKPTSPVKPFTVDLTGAMNMHQDRLTIKASARDFHSVTAVLNLDQQLTVDASASFVGKPATIKVESKLQIVKQKITLDSGFQVQLQRPPFLKNRKVRIPKFPIAHKLSATMDFSPEQWNFDWLSELDSPSISGIALQAGGKGKLHLEPDWDFEKGLSFEYLRTKLQVPQFANMATELAWTTLQIPAPFYRMKGPIDFQIEALNPSFVAADFSGLLKFDLQDGLQSLKFELPFKVKTSELMEKSRAVTAEANLNISHIDIELPRLSPLNIPQFIPDARLKNKKPVAKKTDESFQLKWDLVFRVVNGMKPITLRSNLISNPVPLKINGELIASSHAELQTAFNVEVQKMDLDLFRRQIQIQRIVLDQGSGRVTSIDGLLTHQNSEVKVRMRILGSTEKPEVVWESDPPLSQQQIIAIIVFGKSLNELSQEESASTQNMERAFADGAFGLASLFLLASTPIESISYDPISESYAARLKVGDRTSVSLGSDFEDRQSLAIRRQIGGAWSINTEIQSNSATETDQVSTFLEWFRRF